MSYKVIVTGIVCLILNEDANGYLVSVPDGRNVDNPRHPGTPIDSHVPFLIIRAVDLLDLDNWPGNAYDGALYLPIDVDATLEFEYATDPLELDSVQFFDNAYSWAIIDPNFDVHTLPPPSSVANTEFRHGVMHARRIPGGEAMVIEMEVPVPEDIRFFTVTSNSSSGHRSVRLANDAEIVIANVSTELIANPGWPTNDDDHIFIYYGLNESGSAPDLNLHLSAKNDLAEVVSDHPFLNAGRDLNVHCSPIKYP